MFSDVYICVTICYEDCDNDGMLLAGVKQCILCFNAATHYAMTCRMILLTILWKWFSSLDKKEF
jgi:hypothetical protein